MDRDAVGGACFWGGGGGQAHGGGAVGHGEGGRRGQAQEGTWGAVRHGDSRGDGRDTDTGTLGETGTEVGDMGRATLGDVGDRWDMGTTVRWDATPGTWGHGDSGTRGCRDVAMDGDSHTLGMPRSGCGEGWDKGTGVHRDVGMAGTRGRLGHVDSCTPGCGDSHIWGPRGDWDMGTAMLGDTGTAVFRDAVHGDVGTTGTRGHRHSLLPLSPGFAVALVQSPLTPATQAAPRDDERAGSGPQGQGHRRPAPGEQAGGTHTGLGVASPSPVLTPVSPLCPPTSVFGRRPPCTPAPPSTPRWPALARSSGRAPWGESGR